MLDGVDQNIMSNLYEWFHDDITWCGDECSYTECERNLANKLSKTGLYSAAMFKGTEMCPLAKLADRLNEFPDVNVASAEEILKATNKAERSQHEES